MHRIQVSGQLVVYINGKIAGNTNEFGYTPSTPADEIRGIDSSEAFELADTTSSCDFSVGFWRIIKSGGVEGLAMAVLGSELPRNKYFSLMVIDKLSDDIVFQGDKCKIVGQNWAAAPKQMVVGRISAKAISWNNEVKPFQG